MPLKINPGAPHFDSNIFWRYSQHLIKSRDCFFVTPQGLVSKGGLLEYRKIARVQFQRLLHLIERLPPTALPSIDVAGQRSEEHTSELQSQSNLVCRLLLE